MSVSKPLPPFLTGGLRKPAITRLLASLGGAPLPPPAAAAADGNVKEEAGAAATAAAACSQAEGEEEEDGGGTAAAPQAAAGAEDDDVGALPEGGLDVRLAQRLPGVLRDALKTYQWEGAKFVVRRGGRGLIGDEMGE